MTTLEALRVAKRLLPFAHQRIRQIMTIFNFPLRQSDSRPSPKAQAVAARVRVNADRRGGVKTPKWIVALSKTPAAT